MSDSSKPLRRRDVLDTKNPGEPIWVAATRARDARYQYFLHNDRVYEVTRGGFASTSMTVEDIR